MTRTAHQPLEPYLFIVPPHEPDDDTVTPVEDPRKPKPLPDEPPEEWDEDSVTDPKDPLPTGEPAAPGIPTKAPSPDTTEHPS